jgi:hypothetical protein
MSMPSKHDLLALDLPHVRGVRRQHVDQLHRFKAHGLQEAQLLVQGPRQVLGQLHPVAVVLVVEDDALLRGPEHGDLERPVGRVLHRVDDALEDRARPLDLLADRALVERLVLDAVTGRAVVGDAAEHLGDEVEDRLELEARRLPLVVLRPVAQNVQARPRLLEGDQLGRVLVGHPQVVAAVGGFELAAEHPALQPVRPGERRHRRDGEQDLFAANLHVFSLPRSADPAAP